ncbi:exosortase F-associated protein [Weeksella virosa]|uniref:exosortase F system-associated membrane protein n=1 Tax=Weeksella virosa TaxID=1014 RepID=UPI000DFD83A9|nr:exosortase F system-associated protein [Weeksella virosa]SUP54261.1 exosortase F-associated protein [Weeksella virosa]
MKKWLRFLWAALFLVGLIMIRVFEKDLFYDPFIEYFQRDTSNQTFPYYVLSRVNASILFRYALNALLTTAIIAVLFQNKKYTRFTVLVLIISLFVLLPLYNYAIKQEFQLGTNIGFYIRRFLIQPMYVLLLIPSFFYQNYLNKNNREN